MSLAAEDTQSIGVAKSAVAWSMRDSLSLAIALVFTQALFWVFVTGIVQLSPLKAQNLEQFRVLNLTIAAARSLEDPTPIAPFQFAPTHQILVPNPGLVRFSLVVKDPNQGVGVFIPRLADNAVLFVNGHRLSPPQGEWSDHPTRTGVIGILFEVPTANLIQGSNRFELFVVRECCRAFVNAIYAGPLPQLVPIGAMAHSSRVTLTFIIIGTSLLIGLVGASLLPLKRGRAFIWSVIACSATVALGSYFYIDTGNLISTQWRTWYGHIAGAVLGYLAFLSLVNAWTNGPAWTYRATLAVGTFVTVTTAALLPFQSQDQVLATARFFLLPVMIFAIIGVLALLWRYVQTKEVGRYWQAGLLLISATAALIDYLYALQVRVQPIYFVPFSNLTLMAAIGIALAQRGAHLYLEAEAANLTLEARISAKESELVAAAAALRDQEAQTATQTERARIMRDMHDGMGGQLLSLLVQTRDPDTPRKELEEAVEAAISDLRLLVDSLDSVGDSLDVALAVFRDRVLPRIRAAGVQLGWQNELKAPTSGHSPSVTLNVYRILQEAMSNALRHSGATKIGISIAPSDMDRLILIEVADNGHGFTDSAAMGRGLANMRRRASEIGGKLVIASSAKGTKIGLLVPT
jgi:two-component system, NarL family, sensor histidine kinase UhpB